MAEGSGERVLDAVPRNLPAMMSFWRRVGQLWQAALNRRSHMADTGWKQMDQIINGWLPSLKVMHPYSEQRFCVVT